MTYSFSSIRPAEKYYGRSVLPNHDESISEALDVIECSHDNLTTEDYIFCPQCEIRFSAIEGFFAEKIITPLSQKTVKFNADRSTYETNAATNNLLIRVYILGLFWRTSISTKYSAKLKKPDEEKIRLLLNATMGSNVPETLTNIELVRE